MVCFIKSIEPTAMQELFPKWVTLFSLVSRGRVIKQEYPWQPISIKNIKFKISNGRSKYTNLKSLTLVCEEIICWCQHQGIPCHHFLLYLYSPSHYQLIHHKFLFQEWAALFYHFLQHDPWNVLLSDKCRSHRCT